MSITYTLPNFPLVNQRSEPTMDGYPDENADWNCVPASLAAGLMYLTGKTFDGDELHDAVYGQGYRGGQTARAYITYCARQGVTLEAFDSTNQSALISRIHSELLARHPVVLTMPSQWGIPPADPLHPSGTTHVGIACGYGPGMLRIMNPWGGFWHDGTDDYWAARLCCGEVWVMSTQQGAQGMGVPTGWKDDGATLTAPNGHVVVQGFRGHVIGHTPQWAADDQPIENEHGVASVLREDARWGKGTRQLFVRSGLFWAEAPDKAVAAGPTLGEVPVGIELLATERDLDTTTNELAQRDNELTAAVNLAAAKDAALTAAQQQIAGLQQQIATLEQQLQQQSDPVAAASKAALATLKATLAQLP